MDKVISNIGNLFILVAIFLISYIYYPYILSYLIPAKAPTQFSDNTYMILIPKISAYSNIISKVDPSNRSEYLEALKKGVAEAKGFSKPGEAGTVFLFAHSSLEPWEMTRVNTPFLRLNELNPGDELRIVKGENTFTYHVQKKLEVFPNETQYIYQSQDKLILQTCTPVGLNFKRLLVFAD